MPARAPEELDVLIQQAFNQGDIDAVVALYDPAAIVRLGGAAVNGA